MMLTGSNPLLLSEILSPATVELSLRGQQRDDVLRELIERIPALAGDEGAKATLLRALQEREDLHSTGIGDGIALPHARNALVGLVHQPVIVFGRHPTGIAYRAVDNVPARLFFLLVATNVSQHLSILARVSRLLRDPRMRQGLLTVEKPELVLSLIRDAETKN
jgi:mannitol/fructose-specific phosphotransferase system IIA component (Ntr-type)